MTFAVVFLCLSILASLVSFILRKTVKFVFKLVPLGCLVVLLICTANGISVFSKISEYKKLCNENVEELKQNAEAYSVYLEDAKNLNEWIISYQTKIKSAPAFTFFKDEVEKMDLLEISES
jgi:hypothetical protein